MTKSKKSGPASSFQMIIKIINKVYRFSFHSDYLSLWRRVLLFQLNAKFYYGVSKTQISSPLPWKQYAASLTELRHFCKNRSRDPVIRIFRNDLAALVKGDDGAAGHPLARRRSNSNYAKALSMSISVNYAMCITTRDVTRWGLNFGLHRQG